MSQPPYPPPGGNDAPGQQPGSQGWGQPEEPTEQFGQPAPPTSQFQPGQYGAPGAGNDQTAQFAQPQYGQPEYGQPQYGQPGQPQYGQPEYGQPQYGQPQYGGPGGPGGPIPPPGYGPGGPGGSSGGSGKLIAIIAAIVVVLAGVGVGLFFLLKDDGDDNTPAANSSTSTTFSDPSSAFENPSTSSSEPVDCQSPTGDSSPGIPDPEDPCDITEPDPDGDFTPLAEDCAAENWSACDELWGVSPVDSDWEQYGGTCGGRVSYEAANCVSRFEGGDSGGSTGSAPTATSAPVPPGNLGDDPAGTFAPLAQACFNGDYAACDQLWITTPVGSDWEQYAGTCAGRVEYESGTCESRLG